MLDEGSVVRRCKHLESGDLVQGRLEPVVRIVVETLPGKEHHGRALHEVFESCEYCCSFLLSNIRHVSAPCE